MALLTAVRKETKVFYIVLEYTNAYTHTHKHICLLSNKQG